MDCGRKWNERGKEENTVTKPKMRKKNDVEGDMEIGMNHLMQGDKPVGILRTEDLRKDIEKTEILEQTNEIATGGTI
jgi:hypothetical protein